MPDNVLEPLINAIHADSYFTAFPATREEEAVGIVAGDYGADLVTMARGAGLKQSAWAADEEMFDQMMGRALTEDGRG